MKWTTSRIIWACILVTQPIGIVLLLAYFMPRWEEEDKEKEE